MSAETPLFHGEAPIGNKNLSIKFSDIINGQPYRVDGYTADGQHQVTLQRTPFAGSYNNFEDPNGFLWTAEDGKYHAGSHSPTGKGLSDLYEKVKGKIQPPPLNENLFLNHN